MKITFCGGADSVTGANYLLEEGDDRILIDCGLHQGDTYCEAKNFEQFSYDPRSIKGVLITHAHIDHTGRLPKLYKDGFRGNVYSTPPTKDFAKELLADSEDILLRVANSIARDPLYTLDHVKGLIGLWKGVHYGEQFEIGGFTVIFHNAGHILGSACIEIRRGGKTIVFSGDLGNSNPPIIRKADELDIPADYCLIESTYGDRLHDNNGNREEQVEDIIEETVSSGGTLMIPSFAMERTQQLLYTINELVENNRIPRIPVFIDSPLAIRLTAVYKWYEDYFSEDAWKYVPHDESLFSFPGLQMAFTQEESKMINGVPSPKIIIAGSGMSQGGRILHHERRYLADPKSTILIVGYQADNSLGRRILDGEKYVEIFGEGIEIRCRVRSIDSYSAHADQNGLMHWIHPMRQTLQKVFVVQGDGTASKALQMKLRDDMALDAIIPTAHQSIEL
ncbi:MAG: MBL fold metallo-hydrolase [bacterium]